MSLYLMIDFGSTFTKLTAVDTEKEDIIGTSSHFTTVDTDITIGYNNALEKLYEKIGERVNFDKVIACSSAAGGLKMCAIGPLLCTFIRLCSQLGRGFCFQKFIKCYFQ